MNFQCDNKWVEIIVNGLKRLEMYGFYLFYNSRRAVSKNRFGSDHGGPLKVLVRFWAAYYVLHIMQRITNF